MKGNMEAKGDRLEETRFEAIFDRHYPAVAAYVARRASPELVDDVLADTFLVVWRRLDDVPADPLPWLIGVARKTLATHRRAQTRRLSLISRLVATRMTPSGDSANETAGVTEALRRLSARDREAITLIAWEGLTPREAAAAVGVSPVAFRVRLHRAKRRLRDLLDKAKASESSLSAVTGLGKLEGVRRP
jgi:RNA polymerase sigma-70 factor (ECF subfamily)